MGLEPEPADSKEKAVTMHAQLKDKALLIIMMAIRDESKPSVLTLRDPEILWNRLRTIYQTNSESSIDSKILHMQSIRVKLSETILQYTIRLTNIANELAVVGYVVSDMQKERYILRGLTAEYRFTAQIIRANQRTYDQAVADLIVHECFDSNHHRGDCK